MHEWGITQDLIDEVKKQAGRGGIEKVTLVQVSLGKKSDITGHALKTCFKALTKDTPLCKVRLQIKNSPDHKVLITAITGDRTEASVKGGK